MTKNKPPRELAARALCRKAGNPENTMFEGKPMWQSYLDEVDTVIKALQSNIHELSPVRRLTKGYDCQKTAGEHMVDLIDAANGSVIAREVYERYAEEIMSVLPSR